jgi:hypothetical protein
MSIRFDLDEDVLKEIDVVLNKNMKDILLNTRLIGAKRVDNWESFLTKDALPEFDDGTHRDQNMVSFASLGVSQKIQPILQRYFKDNVVRTSGFFHYPETGYMGWHTNSDNPCKRLYITWTKEGNKSFFRYLENDTIITDYDDTGYTVRMFDVTAQEPYMWHCVGSETDRISMGFAIK